MKFNKAELLTSYNTCKSAVNKNNVLPIFSNLRIMGRDNQYKMISANSTYQIISTGEYEGDNFDLCFDAQKFGLMLSASNDIIEMSQKDGKVLAKSGKSKYNFAVLSGENMPIIEHMQEDLIYENLSNLLSGVYLNAPTNHTNQILNGVSVFVGGSHIKAFASDGFSLAFSQTKTDSNQELQFIIPVEVAGIIASGSCEYFCADKKQLFVCVDGKTSIISKVIDGAPPNFEKTLPESLDYFFSLSRKELERIADICIKAGDRSINLHVAENGKVIAKTTGTEFSIETEIDAKCNSELKESFNPVMIKNLCKIITSDRLKITYTSVNNVNRYMCYDGDKSYLMMPLRA